MRNAKEAPIHGFDDGAVFEGCMPVEVMARRGEDTLRFGPLKPRGLPDPKTGKEPYAVVQLRRDNADGSIYNLVGFQTHLRWPEQKRVFTMIPALKDAQFLRYGVMHRNTYLDSPRLLDRYYRLKSQSRIAFAGQMTGVEGYVESCASGFLVGVETARRLKETGSSFDGSAAKTGEDVIAAVERETAELAAMQAAGAAPEAAETVQDEAAKPQLLDFLAGAPEAENDPFADQPTQTAPELPELTPAQELAGYIRSRSAAALVTPHALLVSEVENADELLAQMPQDPQCEDIVVRAGAKDTYYYSNANMSDNYAMIAQLIEDKDLCVMFAEMVRFNARVYPSATPLKYFQRSPYGLAPEEIEQTWKTMQGRPEFADIEELTNNQNERFLFSTQHLTRRYAKAISDVDDFCD